VVSCGNKNAAHVCCASSQFQHPPLKGKNMKKKMIVLAVSLAACLSAQAAPTLDCVYSARSSAGEVLENTAFELACDQDFQFVRNIGNGKVIAGAFIPEGCQGVIGFFQNSVDKPIKYETIETEEDDEHYPWRTISVDWLDKKAKVLHQFVCDAK
jgi:hypothetical protein